MGVVIAFLSRRFQHTITQDRGFGRVLVTADSGEFSAQVIGIFNVDDLISVEACIFGTLIETMAFFCNGEIKSDCAALVVGKLRCVLLTCGQSIAVCDLDKQARECHRIFLRQRPFRAAKGIEIIEFDGVKAGLRAVRYAGGEPFCNLFSDRCRRDVQKILIWPAGIGKCFAVFVNNQKLFWPMAVRLV